MNDYSAWLVGPACIGLMACAAVTGGCECAGTTCSDGIKNGPETDVDCGGPSCAKCADGKACSGAVDCTSGVCTGGVCEAATATCSLEKPVPVGLNNPFRHPDSDNNSKGCISGKSVLTPGNDSSGKPSYMERHIESDALKACIPNGAGYMENIRKIGVNIISQHFPRRYCEDDCNTPTSKQLPYFGLEEGQHRNHEIAVQLYINGFNNHFWAAIEPASTTHFSGDIKIEESNRYYPNSVEGFAEWQRWLRAMFDYLDAHKATDKLLYAQLGNESDGDYAKSIEAICKESNSGNDCTPEQILETSRDHKNPKHYHWLAYAELIETAYAIITDRAPKTQIAIGALGAGGITIDGFQKPVLEYLSGKIDRDGKIVNDPKRCGGTGCFDVYDYHDFAKHKDYQRWKACWPRNCENSSIEITKSPEYFRGLLNDTNFPEKKLVIQQGGTYTGADNKINKEYQTEEDQAAYLVKRATYLAAQGVKAMQFGTYIEHFGFKGTIHSWFTLMGLTYNGTPTPGEVPTYVPKPDQDIIDKHGNRCHLYPEKFMAWCGYNKNKDTCDGQFPCPDPGKDVKKLSWFSHKKLIATLRCSNWENVASLIPPGPNTTAYAYKFIKNDITHKPIYVAWWDWWNDCPRDDAVVEECQKNNVNNYAAMDSCVKAIGSACVATNRPTITISVGDNVNEVQLTEAIPDFITGQEAEEAGYENAFKTYTVDAVNGKAEIRLGKKPLYIEEVPGI